MIILYTTEQGGDWIPWNTPRSIEELKALFPAKPGPGLSPLFVVSGECLCCDPENDELPRFYSILLPTAERWDALNMKWTSYLCGKEFKEFWAKYITNYQRRNEDPCLLWKDQGR